MTDFEIGPAVLLAFKNIEYDEQEEI